MALTIYPKEKQAYGQFDAGAILENKPIGFPHEGGELRPYSNLFYWAHAWSDNGGLIGEHPHQGFEIMSFVLKGEIEHYDNQLGAWKKLQAGDAQIIRSGNGISHAEKFLPGSHIFQVWVDPNLQKTLKKSASYNDYRSDSFPVHQEDNMTIKTFRGEGAPMQMDAEEIEIKQLELNVGEHVFNLNPDRVYSYYLIEGQLEIGDQYLRADDFFLVKDLNIQRLQVTEKSVLFLIETSALAPYTTYAMMQGLS
ncbi:pirin family protein [Fulvivirgaceae bacterium BMA10]|uniref:Pirin family protein n=1 Tax=Splendidivirga corallicola TaxID=3051826 RepID=A0ABT8KVT8_9BACT|nr:pirin family protein [Fulvivirgaceae bacterium BMA10]